MDQSRYGSEMANIREKIRTFEKQGKEVVYSAIFITGKDKVKLVDRASPRQLALIGRNLKYEHPQKVRIELYDGEQAKNMLWVAEIMLTPTEEEEKGSSIPFAGLGEAGINQLVDERFRERQRNLDYEQLKTQAGELMDENQQLQDELQALQNQVEQLEKELETKKNIRYYAGMLGDILESFGIAKDTIRSPLAGLMGISGDQKPKGEGAAYADHSGLLREVAPEEEKRNEIITLISEYLKACDNQTLANVFSIFSEVEKDKTTAGKILQYIHTLKKQDHANI